MPKSRIQEFRYEKKIIIDDPLIDSIEKLGIFNCNEIYSERRINSIYYDTDDLKLARDGIEGFSSRFKIRLRFYGIKNNFSDSILEIKLRQGSLGKKYFARINKPELLLENFSLFDLIYIEDIPKHIMDILGIIKPKLFISYIRKYFYSDSFNFRLTFDKDILFKEIICGDIQSILNQDLITNYYKRILEIKYNYDELISFEKFNSPHNIRASSCSKYLIGLAELGILRN